MRIDGVTALNAATMTLNAACNIEGNNESRLINVLYEAMIIGGRGGKSAAEADGACSTGTDG